MSKPDAVRLLILQAPFVTGQIHLYLSVSGDRGPFLFALRHGQIFLADRGVDRDLCQVPFVHQLWCFPFAKGAALLTHKRFPRVLYHRYVTSNRS